MLNEKGMIPKVKEGELLNFGPMGKSHASAVKPLMLVGAVIAE